VNQRLVSHHYWIEDGAARTFHSPHRFVWPSELDLMAKLAGLELRERWADWNEVPFTAPRTSRCGRSRTARLLSRGRPHGGHALQTRPTLMP
jgi:hypothetical protein